MDRQPFMDISPLTGTADLPSQRTGRTAFFAVTAGILLVAGGALLWHRGQHMPVPPRASPIPEVSVSKPLQRTVADEIGFLGQFSAVNAVELRPQVGGTLTEIRFLDGQVVKADEILFLIDPRPYQIKLEQAAAQYQTAEARRVLAETELWRAQQLKRTDFGTAETVDQRSAELRAAQAAVTQAKAAINDSQLDLGYSRVTAPFAGRISDRRVSVGGLINGSRAGTGPTTLLSTLVSLDPIYLDFNMSEADYQTYENAHVTADTGPDGAVAISIDGGAHYGRHGRLDFIDNAVDRHSGTIHARATVPNPGFLLTPGSFARLQLTIGKPEPVLMVPARSVTLDQSRELVMTVAADGTVVPKQVTTGTLIAGLRTIRSGLEVSDRIIIDGLMRAPPGTKVAPVDSAIEAEDPSEQK